MILCDFARLLNDILSSASVQKNSTTGSADSDCHSGNVVVAADHDDDGSIIFGVGQHSPLDMTPAVGCQPRDGISF